MKRIVEYILLSITVIAAAAGCYFWYSYEKNRSADLQTLASYAHAKNMLSLYAQQYAAYPGAKDDYLQRLGIMISSYTPRTVDGSDCGEPRCASYALTFTLSTNAFMPRGEHTATPQGVQ